MINVGSAEIKKKVVTAKGEFRGSDIWLKDDLTERQYEIQEWLQEQVRTKLAAGHRTKLGYMKIYIDNDVWFFNEMTAKLEKEFFRAPGGSDQR